MTCEHVVSPDGLFRDGVEILSACRKCGKVVTVTIGIKDKTCRPGCCDRGTGECLTRGYCRCHKPEGPR